MAGVPARWRVAESQVPLLNAKQRQVLDLIEAGHTNGDIAERLGITLSGAKWHVSELLTVLGFFSREEMAEFWEWRRSRKPGLKRLGVGGLLRPRWIGPAAAVGVGLAVAVPWLLMRASGSDEPAAVTSEAATPAAVASLAPSLSLRAEQLPLPPSGASGNLAYLNEAGDLMVKPMPAGTAEVVRRANSLSSPRWAPSGKYLAVVEHGMLTVLDERGKLTPIAVVDGDTWGWSTTRDSLAVFTAAGMWLFDPVSGATRVLRGQGAPLPEVPGPVIWSPDGTRLLYQLWWSVTAPGRDMTSELRIFDLRTGEDHLLVSQKAPPTGGTSPTGWSEDGEWVYYREAGGFGRAPAWAVGSTGGTPPRMIEEGSGLGEPGAGGTFRWMERDELMDWWRP